MIRIAYLAERTPTDLPERLSHHITDFQEHRPAADQTFLALWEDYLKQINQAQKQGIKAPIAVIFVSWLRSEIATGSHGYRLDAYDSNWFVDFTECSQTWTLDFIWHYWQEDIAYLAQSIMERYDLPKVYEYEFDYLKLDYAEAYHHLTKAYFKAQINQISQLPGFQTMAKKDDFTIYIGEYLDQAEPIFPPEV